MISMFVKAGLILSLSPLVSCATQQRNSELSGSSKNLVGQKVYSCNYKVLYENDKGKTKLQAKMRPLGILPDKWQFVHNEDSTPVTSEQCKKLASVLIKDFALDVGQNENGFTEYKAQKALAIYWQSNDATAIVGQHDSHGVICSDSFGDSDRKNQAYDAFGYSCSHEYMRAK